MRDTTMQDMPTREHEKWFSPGGGAESVKGFLSPLSAQFFSLLLSFQLDQAVHGNLVEIGTFMGRTFIGLVKASRENESVIGLDIFPDYVQVGFLQAISTLDGSAQSRVIAVKCNTLALSTSDWILKIRRPARFLHIDGGHSYAAIINDLHLASAVISDMALIILDDFMHDWYPDLTEGIIDGLRASRNIVPVAIIPRLGTVNDGGTKLVCAHKNGAQTYRNLLENKFQNKAVQTRILAGHTVLTFQGFGI